MFIILCIFAANLQIWRMPMENDDIFVLSGGGRNLISVKKKDLESYSIPYIVTAIGKKAFKGCSSLLEIIVPNNVKNIGAYAFSDCMSLMFVRLPEGITTIGKGAFCNCISIKEIYLPENIKEIGGEAFMNCHKLRKISIPEGITKIGIDCFANCNSLEEIILPNSLKEIDGGAFRNCMSLKEINIPSNVVSISRESFSGCISLKKVKLHSIYTKIEDSCFRRCSKLFLVLDPSIIKVDSPPIVNYEVFKDLYYSSNRSIKVIIDKLSFNLQAISKDILIQLACDSLNDHIESQLANNTYWQDFYFDDTFNYSSPKENGIVKLAKISLNYIRHELTPYEKIWWHIKGILSIEKAEREMYDYYHQLLKTKVNEIIYMSYPWIKESLY